MGEAELSLFNPFRAVDLCNLAIKNYCNLLSTVTLDITVFTVRKTFLERLSDFLDAEEEPEHSIQVQAGFEKQCCELTLTQDVT